KQLDFECAALDAGDRDFLRAAALGVVEDDRIDERAIVTVGGGKNAGGARHGLKGVWSISSDAPGARDRNRCLGLGPTSPLALAGGCRSRGCGGRILAAIFA